MTTVSKTGALPLGQLSVMVDLLGNDPRTGGCQALPVGTKPRPKATMD